MDQTLSNEKLLEKLETASIYAAEAAKYGTIGSYNEWVRKVMELRKEILRRMEASHEKR